MAVCWRDEVQKMQVHEANVAIDYRNADRCKSWIAGSAGEIRLCMDTSPAWWAERAIRWMTRYDSRLSRRPARVYVCRVRMICAFCISAAVLRAVFSCIVTVYALWCSQKIESDSRDSACEPAPSRCYAPRSHMHTGASAHATQAGRRLPRRD